MSSTNRMERAPAAPAAGRRRHRGRWPPAPPWAASTGPRWCAPCAAPRWGSAAARPAGAPAAPTGPKPRARNPAVERNVGDGFDSGAGEFGPVPGPAGRQRDVEAGLLFKLVPVDQLAQAAVVGAAARARSNRNAPSRQKRQAVCSATPPADSRTGRTLPRPGPGRPGPGRRRRRPALRFSPGRPAQQAVVGPDDGGQKLKQRPGGRCEKFPGAGIHPDL